MKIYDAWAELKLWLESQRGQHFPLSALEVLDKIEELENKHE